MFWRKRKQSLPCIPEHLAYSIVNELRRKIPAIISSVELYVWLIKGESYPKVLMRSVGEALKYAYETLGEEDFLHFSSQLVFGLSFGNHDITNRVIECIKNGKYNEVDKILCLKNRIKIIRA